MRRVVSESTAALKECVCVCEKAASVLLQLLYMTVSVLLEHSKKLLLCLSGQTPVSLPFEGFCFLTHLFSPGEPHWSPASSPIPGSPGFFLSANPRPFPPRSALPLLLLPHRLHLALPSGPQEAFFSLRGLHQKFHLTLLSA